MDRVRSLSQNMTDAERRLWFALRNRRLAGFKFRRQHPVGPFVSDFACLQVMLIVEVDGGQHARSQSDKTRTAYLERQGFSVLRLWNSDVLNNLPGVLSVIEKVCQHRSPSPQPSPQWGEGAEVAG